MITTPSRLDAWKAFCFLINKFVTSFFHFSAHNLYLYFLLNVTFHPSIHYGQKGGKMKKSNIPKINRRNLFLLVLIALCLTQICSEAFAQNVLDGAYVKENSPKRRMVPYTHLREADVTFCKRIWRVIDVREKMNQAFCFPFKPTNERKALIDVIRDALDNGQLVAYGNPLFDDEFKVPLTKSEQDAIFVKWETALIIDPDTGKEDSTKYKEELGAEKVTQFLLKEDWFFDKQRSVMDVRIIGLCPMAEDFSQAGEFRGYRRLFWIYFPEARPVFSHAEVFNRKNDEERRTFEDVFEKRQFSSYVVKESNVYDRYIINYKTGLDQLLESDKIKADVANWEHDLWHF